MANDWYGIVAFIIMWIVVTASCQIFCKHARVPRVFGVPLFPWVPSGEPGGLPLTMWMPPARRGGRRPAPYCWTASALGSPMCWDAQIVPLVVAVETGVLITGPLWCSTARGFDAVKGVPLRQVRCVCVRVRAGSMILNCFLLCTLDRDSYIRFGIWSGFCVCVYLFYSLHSIAYHHEEAGEKLPQFKCAPSLVTLHWQAWAFQARYASTCQSAGPCTCLRAP